MKFERALFPVVAAALCLFGSLITPRGVAASVDFVNQWPAKPTAFSDTATGTITGNFTPGMGNNRVMLVAVATEYSAAQTPAITVTYGGSTPIALTQILTNTTGLNKIWLGYLNEANLASASAAGKKLTVTTSITTNLVAMYANVAVFNGVDQTTPILASQSSSTAGAASLALTAFNVSGLAGNSGLVAYVSNWNGQTSNVATAGYAEIRDYAGLSMNMASGYSVITASGTTAPTSTAAASAAGAFAAVSLNPATKIATIATGACGDCHGNFPNDGSSRNVAPGMFTGSHEKHAGGSNSNNQYGYLCTQCHYNNTTNAHSTGFKNITGSSLPGNAYNQGKKVATSNAPVMGTCTNTNCHSTGRSNRQYAISPAWGGTTTCLSCHGGRDSSTGAYARSANSFSMSTTHGQHLSKYSTTEINCQMCHGKTVANHTTLKDYTGVAYHGNGDKTVLFTNIAYGSYTSYKKSGTDAGKCTNTACHGGISRSAWSNQGAVNTTNTCTHCHGQPLVANILPANTDRKNFAPGWVNGSNTGTSTDQKNADSDVRVGAHFAHLSSVYMPKLKCNECHRVPSTPFGETTHMTGTRYNSQTLTFAQASTAIKNSVMLSYTTGTATKAATCSTIYCHGGAMLKGDTSGSARKPSWDQNTLIARTQDATVCGRCHGNPPTAGTTSGLHSGKAALTSCGDCHSFVEKTTGRIIDKSKHLDGKITASGGHVFPYPGATHSIAAGATLPASNCSCHDYTNAGTYPVASGTAPNCKSCHTTGLLRTVATSSCYDCHGSTATVAQPNGGVAQFPNYSGSHPAHVTNYQMTCDNCHYNGGTGHTTHGNSNAVAKTRNDVFVSFSSNQAKPTYTNTSMTCTVACHLQGVWGTHLDCVTCHTATVVIGHGPLKGLTRRAVANELKTSGTRNHKSTAVGSDATKWDCIVCHMEGNYATGRTSSQHGDGYIDFRDPDTGTQIKKVRWTGLTFAQNLNDPGGRYAATATNFTTARFSRNLGVVLESDPNWLKVASIQMNLCLKCHDYDGAANSTAWTKNAADTVVGTALQPFGNAAASTTTLYYIAPSTSLANRQAAKNTAGAVMNVFSQLSTGNASYHPVRGRQNNNYVSGLVNMKAPWGNTTKATGGLFGATTVYGYLVSCFDCHAGNGASGQQNSTVVAHGNGTTAAALALRGKTTAAGQATDASPNICTMCHAAKYATTTTGHGTNQSGLSSGPASMNATTFGTCNNCHDTKTANVGARAIAAHGYEGMEATGANFAGGRTYAFWRGGGGNATNWSPGNCAVSCTTETYTPGGKY